MTFNPHHNLVEGSYFSVPCGRCIGCRIDRSREWAVRCNHEAKLYPTNCFLTLTFDDKFLPADYSIKKLDVQNFMKRARERLNPKRIRFFAVGEYGDQTLRPHYHLLIFNHQFTDLKLWKTTQSNKQHFTSRILSELWPYGLATTSHVTYQSAAYVARYNMKKIGGDYAAVHYSRVHPLSGQLVQVQPEFMLCSRRPGIGAAWYQTFKSDIYPSDFVSVDGRKHPVPRYYFKMHEEEEAKKVSRARKRQSLSQREHMTKERLLVREEVKASRIKLLKREI